MPYVQYNGKVHKQRSSNNFNMWTAKYPLGKDISWVTASFLFFLHYDFLTNFDYIRNIFLDKNIILMGQWHFAAVRTVTPGGGCPVLLFLTLLTAPSLQFHCRTTTRWKSQELGTVLNSHPYHTSPTEGNCYFFPYSRWSLKQPKYCGGVLCIPYIAAFWIPRLVHTINT